VARFWSRIHSGGRTSVTTANCGTWTTTELTWFRHLAVLREFWSTRCLKGHTSQHGRVSSGMLARNIFSINTVFSNLYLTRCNSINNSSSIPAYINKCKFTGRTIANSSYITDYILLWAWNGTIEQSIQSAYLWQVNFYRCPIFKKFLRGHV